MIKLTLKSGGLEYKGRPVKAIDSHGRISLDSCLNIEMLPSECRHLRITQCAICGGYFVGHFAAKTCSSVCSKELHNRRVSENNAKRNELVLEHIKAVKCYSCGGLIADRKRRYYSDTDTGKHNYCSAKCRQSAYRKWRDDRNHEKQKRYANRIPDNCLKA